MMNEDTSSLEKVKTKIFLLQNEYLKKEHEILQMEGLLKKLKNYKKSKKVEKNDLEYEIQTHEENIIKNLITEQLEHYRQQYQKLTRQTIAEKTKTDEFNKKIEESKNEIEKLKNPPLTKNFSNTSELFTHYNSHHLNNYNTINSNNDPNTLLKLMDNNSSVTINNEKNKNCKNEEILKKLNEEVNANKIIINDITKEMDQFKKLNDKIEKDMNHMNNDLSNKFSLIYQLEMKLDKLKMKKKSLNIEKVEENNRDKIKENEEERIC